MNESAGLSEHIKITHIKENGEVVIQEIGSQKEDNLKKILYLINKIKEEKRDA